jgi:4-amino-4-deoxy-L-arabinose transferase-like glycosyltransferase
MFFEAINFSRSYMNGKTNAIKVEHCFCVFAVLVFLIGTLMKLHVPIVEWDQISFKAAKNWSVGINQKWVFDHPPLYPFFLTILFKIFGTKIAVARIGNVIVVCIAAIMLFRLVTQAFNRQAAYFSVGFYLFNPVCIQGTYIMDVADTSILPLCFILLLFPMRQNVLNPTCRSAVFLGCLIGLCFWAKISSTIALLISLAAALFVVVIVEKKPSGLRSLSLNLAAVTFGLVLFLISWYFVAKFLWGIESFKAPFSLILRSLSNNEYESEHMNVVSMGYHSLQTLVWFSPYFILMWIIGLKYINASIGKTFFSIDPFSKILTGSSLIYVAGYIVIGGTNWGYARYHAAILPYLSIIIGLYLSELIRGTFGENIAQLMIISIVFGALVSLASLNNDPLLFLNLQLKELMIKNFELSTIIKKGVQSMVPLYAAPILITLALCKFSKQISAGNLFNSVLIAGTLYTLTFLNIQQLTAHYRTANQYGAEGKSALIDMLRKNAQHGSVVLGTPEFTYELEEMDVPYSGWSIWRSQERFNRYVSMEKPVAIVTGMTVNTFKQIKWLLSKENQEFLMNDYSFLKIGTYLLWLRNNRNSSPQNQNNFPAT